MRLILPMYFGSSTFVEEDSAGPVAGTVPDYYGKGRRNHTSLERCCSVSNIVANSKTKIKIGNIKVKFKNR